MRGVGREFELQQRFGLDEGLALGWVCDEREWRVCEKGSQGVDALFKGE